MSEFSDIQIKWDVYCMRVCDHCIYAIHLFSDSYKRSLLFTFDLYFSYTIANDIAALFSLTSAWMIQELTPATLRFRLLPRIRKDNYPAVDEILFKTVEINL